MKSEIRLHNEYNRAMNRPIKPGQMQHIYLDPATDLAAQRIIIKRKRDAWEYKQLNRKDW